MQKSKVSKEKKIVVNGIEVNYKIAGGERPFGSAQNKSLLILHGWGSSSDSWVKVQELLSQKGYQAIIPDLPGFGKTLAPSPRSPWRSRASAKPGPSLGEGEQEAWGIEEYADFVYQFAEKLMLEKFFLLGHSFGGQIATQFAVKYPEKVEKLILVAPAGVRRTPGVTKRIVMAMARIISFLLYLVPLQDLKNNIRNALYMFIRHRDYLKAQGIMREVFKRVITQDLTAKFFQIQAPTFIVWRDKDELIPVQDAYLMKELIPHSQLEIIPNAKHSLNFEKPERIAALTATFLGK